MSPGIRSIEIDSVYVYNNTTDPLNYSKLFRYAKVIKVLKSIVDIDDNNDGTPDNANEYLNSSTFTKTEEGDYYVYTKN